MSRDATVELLATGGTIANSPEVDGYLPAVELVESIPELDGIASIETTDVASVGSSAISPELWFRLHRTITEVAGRPDPPDGIVLTHGSNTVEETAYFLQLTLTTDVPVVLTAAQRNHGTVGNDGDRNLVDSVAVAGDDRARGRGVLVVVNDEIHGARDVTKTVSTRPDAWSSGNLGVLGLVDKHRSIRFYRTSDRQHAPEAAIDLGDHDADDWPSVEIVYAAAGDRGESVRSALARGVDGLVLAALPTGSPAAPPGDDSQRAAVEAAAEAGVPVVCSHRGFEGWPYRAEPFVWGDTLTPQKARILLSIALLETSDVERIQELFLEY